jgi:hypothetical protein
MFVGVAVLDRVGGRSVKGTLDRRLWRSGSRRAAANSRIMSGSDNVSSREAYDSRKEAKPGDTGQIHHSRPTARDLFAGDVEERSSPMFPTAIKARPGST